MHDIRARRHARQLIADGATFRNTAATLGVSLSTLYRWVHTETATDRDPPARCWVCDGATPAAAADPYCYLLGQYLGDGHLVTKARVPVLRIYACTDYPAMLAGIADALTAVRHVRPGIVASGNSARLVTVQSYWNHWPCLFPQHGPGRKHERHIGLADWQQQLVNGDPWSLIRGLIHSDGCRSLNKIHVRGKTYVYPRYLFANESRDILAITGNALDRVGVEWRYNRRNSISVARRAAVALMEEHVGPKY